MPIILNFPKHLREYQEKKIPRFKPESIVNYIHDNNILSLFVFDQIFLSSEVKRSMIISNKHGIYELLHAFLKDLGFKILGNQKVSGKSQNFTEL